MVAKQTTINVENIPCYKGIGIHDEEKKMGQRLYVSAYLTIDASRIIESDEVSSTLNYVDVYKKVQEVGKSKAHNLIESFGEEVAGELLKFELVESVRVLVKKPHIPFEDFQGDISIEVTRQK